MSFSRWMPSETIFIKKIVTSACVLHMAYYIFDKLKHLMKNRQLKSSAQKEHHSTEDSATNEKELQPIKDAEINETNRGIRDTIIFSEKNVKCQIHSNCDPCDLPDCSVINIKKLKEYLSSAQKSVDVCFYFFTFYPLAKLLIELNNKSICIRVILDADSIENSSSMFMELIEAGIQVRTFKPPDNRLMHNKFAIVDEKLLISGSANWTSQAFFGNCENIIVTNDHEFVDVYMKIFERLWADHDLESNRKMIEVKMQARIEKRRRSFQKLVNDQNGIKKWKFSKDFNDSEDF